MQVRALKTFNGRLGLIRAGVVITVDDRYGKQLVNNRLAVVHEPQRLEPDNAGDPGPDLNADLGGPQSSKGEGDEGNAADDDSAGSSDEADGDHDETEAETPTRSRRSRASGSTDDSSEDRPAGGRGVRSSSLRQGRPSRKKT